VHEPALTIVMPAHNEAEYLGTALREVTDGMRSREPDYELIVVENGSTDSTLALARDLAAELPHVEVRTQPVADYGAALREGLLAASGELVVTFDVDYYDVDFVDRARALLERSPSTAIVVGSKRAPGANDTRPWPRRMVTAVFTTLVRAGFGLSVSDTHGMKVMRRAVVRPVVDECCFTTDLFDTELVLRVERAGLGTAELPVVVEERRPARTSIWRRVPRTVVGLVKLRRMLHRNRR
jgi:glycosyltransferase involved in cell wall biosynthesis